MALQPLLYAVYRPDYAVCINLYSRSCILVCYVWISYFTLISWPPVLLHNHYQLQPCSPERGQGRVQLFIAGTVSTSWSQPTTWSHWFYQTYTDYSHKVHRRGECCSLLVHLVQVSLQPEPTMNHQEQSIYRINFWPQECCILRTTNWEPITTTTTSHARRSFEWSFMTTWMAHYPTYTWYTQVGSHHTTCKEKQGTL